MRLDNDRPSSNADSIPPLPDFFTVMSYGLLCGLGIFSFLFSPLTMIFAHARLVDPWSKLAAVIGALVAVSIFEQPPVIVILAFVFGLVSADTVSRGISKTWGFPRVLLVGAIAAMASLIVLARTENMGPWQYWVQQVTSTVDALSVQLQQNGSDPRIDWNQWKAIFIYQGPFQYLTLLLLMFWLSVGAAAHFGWTAADSPWGAKNLKAIPMLKWPSFVFLGLFVVVAFRIVPEFAGLLALGRGWMFIQGMVVLARWLGQRKMTRQQKTLAYCLGVFPGFYALIGLGVIGPWFRLQRRKTAKN